MITSLAEIKAVTLSIPGSEKSKLVLHADALLFQNAVFHQQFLAAAVAYCPD
jgi:hypothetical protein